ncbi:DNA-binding response regulator, OmpR family, contains REC and winged-helix (wHTH) domain [Pelagirhabdus alkalitolerans]|uniref:DNA-binding response regulator, OmpR family, contains REC and winged-helix (WHTH) domain n=1 Tax=Pelagirhabdus alkalitolerans TaxID=1612202 RepID=A0A1G6LSZ5_9BACI|nr:response regulator transcription factor [Pelagirhabdus alkalitolerans]SDC46373.1 DNA-binding response regulator, OmpR family, contains REC and winged-helix (wHTH) domain [Pelagirhabdus alkalitolerans]
MQKALLVDDEERMLDLLELNLNPHGFKCIKTTKPEEVEQLIKNQTFHIILLDIMMPNLDGWELCRSIRQISTVPIIMITARDQKQDIVKGLKLGADDYITKPFEESELLARIEAVQRRSQHQSYVEVDGLVWDEKQYQLKYKNQFIKLTPKEFLLIGTLMKKPDQVFSREQLIDLIWGFDSHTEGRTVDSHVRNIRDKVRQTGFNIDQYFVTVWGIGYKWIKSTQ